MKYAFIHAHRHCFKVLRMCEVLSTSTSGYYLWQSRPECKRSHENRALVTRIRCFHQASRRIYGSPRIHRDLVDSGTSVGIKRVARLMKEEGIQSHMRKKFVITTDSRKTQRAAPDHLQRCFRTEAPNKAWVSDTTFIATRQGWLYLAVVLDLFSRQVLGWSISDRNNAQLVKDALMMAIKRRGGVSSVVVHSDQGSTYSSSEYQHLLSKQNLICSMSRKGECLDNAVAESFFGSLKNEWVDDADYLTTSAAKQSLFEYIEIFYNRQRRHSYLNYRSPAQFEAEYASL